MVVVPGDGGELGLAAAVAVDGGVDGGLGVGDGECVAGPEVGVVVGALVLDGHVVRVRTRVLCCQVVGAAAVLPHSLHSRWWTLGYTFLVDSHSGLTYHIRMTWWVHSS